MPLTNLLVFKEEQQQGPQNNLGNLYPDLRVALSSYLHLKEMSILSQVNKSWFNFFQATVISSIGCKIPEWTAACKDNRTRLLAMGFEPQALPHLTKNTQDSKEKLDEFKEFVELVDHVLTSNQQARFFPPNSDRYAQIQKDLKIGVRRIARKIEINLDNIVPNLSEDTKERLKQLYALVTNKSVLNYSKVGDWEERFSIYENELKLALLNQWLVDDKTIDYAKVFAKTSPLALYALLILRNCPNPAICFGLNYLMDSSSLKITNLLQDNGKKISTSSLPSGPQLGKKLLAITGVPDQTSKIKTESKRKQSDKHRTHNNHGKSAKKQCKDSFWSERFGTKLIPISPNYMPSPSIFNFNK